MPATLRNSFRAVVAVFAAGLSGAASAQHRGVWLKIAGSDVHVQNGEVAVLPLDRVALLEVHLERQPNEVAYSRITTWVNAASANIVATQSATEEGIVCTLDLARNPGLALHPGRNSVEVTFKDRWNEAHYASFILQLPGLPSPSDKRSPPALHAAVPYRGARRFAVVVGVAKYEFGGRGVQNIPYADQDAAAFHKELVSPRGGNVPEEHAEFLINENATANKIREALTRISAEARADDVVIVYLNMNGSYDPQDPDRKYLLAYDSDPQDMHSTAIPVASLPGLLSAADGSQHIVVLADTCHGDATGTNAPEKMAGADLVNLYLARAFAMDGQAAMEASDIHQISQAGGQWNDSGVFTHFLIEGMAGAADTNGDGTVTTQELFRYVQMKVSEATMDGQLPMVSDGRAGDVALAGVATAPRAH